MDHGSGHDELPPNIHLPGPSIWPFIISIGIMVAGFGAVFHSFLFFVGLVIMVVGFGGWFREDLHNYRNLEQHGGGENGAHH